MYLKSSIQISSIAYRIIHIFQYILQYVIVLYAN